MKLHKITRLQFNFFLLTIIIITGFIRFASYDFSLPYIDHPDEPNYYLEALKWRGYYDPGGDIPGYPPGILIINSAVQTIVDDNGHKMPDVIRLIRLLSLTTNLMTSILIAFIARRIAGFGAGLIAALSWGIAPVVVIGGVYATADPYTYFFVAMSAWLAIIALQDTRRSSFAVWSVVAGLLAIIFKYPALPALLPGVTVSIYRFVSGHQRYRRRAILFWQAFLIIGVGIFLVFIYEAGRMDIREADTIRTSGIYSLLNPIYISNNLFHVFAPIGGALPLLIIAIGVARLAVVERFSQRTFMVILCLLPMVAIPWIAAAFSFVAIDHRIKDVLPATTLASALLGVGIVEIAKLFRHLQLYATVLIVGGFAAVVWGQQIRSDLDYVRITQPKDRRVDIRQWADQNLAAGTVIVDHENHKTFNPQWSGLVNNRQWFDWLESEDVLRYTPQHWREKFGVTYAALHIAQVDQLNTIANGQSFLNDLLLLRTFTNPPRMRGPETLFYRLWKPDTSLDVTFGDAIHLIGYDVANIEDTTLQFTFYWKATATPIVDYSLFLHLLSTETQNDLSPIAQYDGPPAHIDRPTYTWDHPDETLISQPVTITLPDTIKAGIYSVVIGLYDWSTLERLPVWEMDEVINPQNNYELMQLTIG